MSDTQPAVNAIYIGRRLNGDKPVQAFQLPNKKVVYFRSIVGIFIGGVYECFGGTTMNTRPKRIDTAVTVDPEWEREDLRVEAKVKRRRLEERLKRDSRPAVNRVVDALAPLVKGIGFWEKKALVEYLIQLAERSA